MDNRKSGGGLPRSEDVGDLSEEIPTLDFDVRAKNPEHLPAGASKKECSLRATPFCFVFLFG